ncbi:MAG: helix-turn-helix transcriptional regulator [Propioniciclava sp.]
MLESTYGPQPTADVNVPIPALRVLQALAQVDRAAAITDLTPLVGGHPNSVRLQLDGLVTDGFVELVTTKPQGRGRPAKLYALTVHGRQIAHQDPELGEYPALIEGIADHLATTPDPRGAARQVGQAWGRRIRNRSGASRSLNQTLAAQGFTPTHEDDLIVLRTCPFLGEARQRPEVICSLHQGLVDATAEGPVTLHPFAVPGGCVIASAESVDARPATEDS